MAREGVRPIEIHDGSWASGSAVLPSTRGPVLRAGFSITWSPLFRKSKTATKWGSRPRRRRFRVRRIFASDRATDQSRTSAMAPTKRHALAAFRYSYHLCWCERSAAVYKLRYEEYRVTSYNIERDILVFSLNGRKVKARTGHTQFGTPSGAVIDSRPAPKSRPRLAQSQCGRHKGVASCLQSHRDST